MSQTNIQTCFPTPAARTRFVARPKRLLGVALVALLMISWAAPADEADDQYLRIFDLIQQADRLNANGQPEVALAKYREAQVDLQNFQRAHLDWHVNVVSYRMNYLAQKVAAFPAKAPAPAAAGAATGTRAAQPKIRESGTAAATVAPAAKLLEAGAEPRKVLRLHPGPGDKQSVELTAKMDMDMKIGDMPSQPMKLPPIKMTMDVTAKSVSDDGDIVYETILKDIAVADESGVMPQAAEAMKSALANVKGLSSAGTMSNRGFGKGTEVKVPPDADPSIRQILEQMKESLSSVAIQLPEEAVGPGAKWEVRMPVKSQGMTIAQTTSYELLSLQGERLTAKHTISQSASNQKIENPAMPGLKVDLTQMTGSGTGNLTLDLTRLLPSEAATDSHSELSMGMDVGGQTQAMTMKLDVKAHLEAK